jgi:hypothetical protein
MRSTGAIALVICAFLVFSLLGKIQDSSPEVAGRKLEAAKLLADGIPPLASVTLPLDVCTFLSKDSVTAFDCKFTSSFDPLNAERPANGWKFTGVRTGNDPWRREMSIYAYSSDLWTAEIYLLDLKTISGVSLRRYGPWPY